MNIRAWLNLLLTWSTQGIYTWPSPFVRLPTLLYCAATLAFRIVALYNRSTKILIPMSAYSVIAAVIASMILGTSHAHRHCACSRPQPRRTSNILAILFPHSVARTSPWRALLLLHLYSPMDRHDHHSYRAV